MPSAVCPRPPLHTVVEEHSFHAPFIFISFSILDSSVPSVDTPSSTNAPTVALGGDKLVFQMILDTLSALVNLGSPVTIVRLQRDVPSSIDVLDTESVSTMNSVVAILAGQVRSTIPPPPLFFRDIPIQTFPDYSNF